jgi:hypothetical protein
MDELDLFRSFRRGVAAPSQDAQRRASARLASALDEPIGREHAARPHRGHRRHLVALAAAALVVVVVTASAFGTVRGLFGNGKPHGKTSFFLSDGKRGSFTVRILNIDQELSWRIVPVGTPAPTGQYVHVSGRGRILRIGGHAEAWQAGLVGFVSRRGETKQRVVITMKGRPKGVFVLTPLQPGFLKRDSGTREQEWATG